MKKLILQLFLNKQHILKEIEELQSVTFTNEHLQQAHRLLIDMKHKEWDRCEHMIDLFFESIGM